MPEPPQDVAGRSAEQVQQELARAEGRLGDAQERANEARGAHRDKAEQNERNLRRGKYDDEENESDHPDYQDQERLQGEADTAQRQAEEASADVDRLRTELGSLPTTEDVFTDMGGDNIDNVIAERTPEDVARNSARRNILRTAGLLLTVGGLFLLYLSLQQQQPTGGEPPEVSVSASASASASAPASASAAPPVAQPPSASEAPVTDLRLSWSTQAFAEFDKQSGTCPTFPDQFPASYELVANDGALTATQPGAVPHVSTGTLELVPGSTAARFELTGEGQTYMGEIDGTRFAGTYTDTSGGCNEVYLFHGQTVAPVLVAPPLNDPPGYVEWFDFSSGAISLDPTDFAAASTLEGIVAAFDHDMTTELPIRFVGTSGDDTLFDVTIPPPAASNCRGPSGCSAPVPWNAAWSDPSFPITVIATGAGNDVLAVTMPHGAPVTVAPSDPPVAAAPSETPVAVAAPSDTPVAAAPSQSSSPSSGAASNDGGGPNLPLAALGLALVAGGLGVGVAGPRVIGGTTATQTGTTASTPIETAAASVIAADVAATTVTGRAWKGETAHEASGSRTALIAGAAALLVLAAGVATALATGVIGGPGAAADPSQSQVAEASEPASPSEAASEAPAAPSQSQPVAGPPFPELAGLGLAPPDPTADGLEPVGFHSLEGVDGEYFPDSANAVEYAAWVPNLDQATVDTLFNATTFDCTNVVDGVRTACASNNPIEPGPMFVAAARYAEPIPQESSDGLLIYSLVLDADGDPANNFEAEPPFTNDFFQGTDRWYELVYTPELGWYLTVDRNETLSDARAAIMGDLVVFFVPMAELAVDAPGYRLTSFVSSDASFEPATSGGDLAPGPPDAGFELADPAVGGGGATGFLVRLGQALAEGDTRFLLDRLHSAVIDRYGASACLIYVDAVVDPSNVIDPVRAGALEQWDYETDGLSTSIAEAYPVSASATINGQAIEDAEFHVAMEDGTFRWFTDCGTPAG